MTSGMLQETIPTTPSSTIGPKFRPYASPNHHVTKGRYITSNDPRGYIPVYEYPLNGQWIMMDIDDGYILWTGIWKALGNSKADIVKMIDSQPDLAPMIRRVRGGYLKIQGTWMPYEVALRLSRRVAWPIKDDLVPLFGPTFPSTCLSPDQPGYGQVVASASGRRRARRTIQTSSQPQVQAAQGSSQSPSQGIGSPVMGHHPHAPTHAAWSVSPPPHSHSYPGQGHSGEMYPPPPPQYSPYPPPHPHSHGSYPPPSHASVNERRYLHSHDGYAGASPAAPSSSLPSSLPSLHLSQPHMHPHATPAPTPLGTPRLLSPSASAPATSLHSSTLAREGDRFQKLERLDRLEKVDRERRHHVEERDGGRDYCSDEDRDWHRHGSRDTRSSLSSSLPSHHRYAPYPGSHSYPSRSPAISLKSPSLLRRESTTLSIPSARERQRQREKDRDEIFLPPITPITPASAVSASSTLSLPSSLPSTISSLSSFGPLSAGPSSTPYALPPISALEDLRGISASDSAAVLKRLREPEPEDNEKGEQSKVSLPSLSMRPHWGSSGLGSLPPLNLDFGSRNRGTRRSRSRHSDSSTHDFRRDSQVEGNGDLHMDRNVDKDTDRRKPRPDLLRSSSTSTSSLPHLKINPPLEPDLESSNRQYPTPANFKTCSFLGSGSRSISSRDRSPGDISVASLSLSTSSSSPSLSGSTPATPQSVTLDRVEMHVDLCVDEKLVMRPVSRVSDSSSGSELDAGRLSRGPHRPW